MASPACISTAVSVGATTNSGAIAGFSNLTAGTTIVAPGSSITSSKPTNTYGLLSGTSMAAPVVSGAIAAIREGSPSATVADLVNTLRVTGSRIPTPVGWAIELQLDSAVLGVPSDVSLVATDAGFGQVSLSWSTPNSIGNSLSSYTVTASPGGASCTSPAVDAPGCTVSGLTNGQLYTFTITATNLSGTGKGTSVTATPRGLPAGSPFGSADVISAGVGSVNVAGWAIDPETASPIPVHVYVDSVGTALTANGSRPDVDAAFGYGTDHGYSATIPTSGGNHTVCVYAINTGAGSNVGLGCRTVTVPTGPPVGSFDLATAGPGTVSVGGWAIDPDTASPIAVHVYVDSAGTALTAGGFRSDIAAFFGPFGGNHAFNGVLPASAGTHTVCAYGINTGPGANVLLGCKVVTVPGGSPFGSFDVARRNLDGTVFVGGWAIDPDTASPIAVHVYVFSGGSTVGANALTADVNRSDLASIFPLYGALHGLSGSTTVVAPAGATVCAYGIDVGVGDNVLLGCKVVT
jgi:hypothetical protein